MSIGIQNQANIDNSAPLVYPNGKIKDNPGNNTGTPFDAKVYQDFHQFFAKLLRDAGIVPNNLHDNETNGYQYFQAARRLFRQFPNYTPYLGLATPLTPSGDADHLIHFTGGAGKTVELPESTDPDTMDIVTIRIVNDSANSLSVIPNGAGSDTINGSGSTVTINAGTIKQFTLDKDGDTSGFPNWIITDK